MAEVDSISSIPRKRLLKKDMGKAAIRERPNKLARPRHTDPGTIIRVRMINFLTYSDIEYFLGDSLNMIIGPNGTGKSSFVCAVCLGLGGRPELLGRAKELKDFIKTGTASAGIEIELQGKPGQSNQIVHRVLHSDGSGSFSLNKRKVTQKTINDLVNGFNIQIANLCQFLPQDKVAKFAQSTPHELLLDTERAIGDPSLIEKHEQLIFLAKKRDEYSESVAADTRQLEKAQQAYALESEEIERLENLEKMKTDLQDLERLLPFAKFKKLRSVLNSWKKEKSFLQTQLANYVDQNKDVTQCIEKALLTRQESEISLEQCKNKLRKVEHRFEQQYEKQSSKVQQLQLKQQEFDNIGNEEKKYKEDLATLQAKIKIIDEQLAVCESEVVDEERLNYVSHEFAHIRGQVRGLDSEANQFRQIRQEERRIIQRLASFKQQEEADLSRLNQLPTRQLERFKRLSNMGKDIRDTAIAVEYLREHSHEIGLDYDVLEPPVLSMDIVDPRFSSTVANSIPRRAMLMFTCQSRSDYQKLTSKLLDEKNLMVNIVDFSNTDRHPLKERPPIRSEDLQRYGLNGYIVDLISGPQKVLEALCFELGLHRIPYSSRSLTRSEIDRISNLCFSNGDLIVTRFIDNKSLFQTLKSKYGRKDITSRSEPHSSISPLFKVKTESTDNMSEIEAKAIKIRQYITQINESEDKAQEAEKRLSIIKEEKSKIENRMKALDEEKRQLEEQTTKAARLKTRRDQRQKELQQIINNPRNFATETLELKKELSDLSRQTVDISESLNSSLEEMLNLEKDSLQLDFVGFVASNESKQLEYLLDKGRSALQTQLSQVQTKIDEAELEVETFKKSHSNITKQERIQINAAIQRETEESLQGSINSLKAKLTLADHSGDVGRRMRTFAELKEQINVLEARLEENTTKSSGIYKEIAKIRSSWEPELDRLVTIVSGAFKKEFEAVGCKGRVDLVKEGDSFKDWKIEIKVAFRAEEELQLLTGQRQSGGERAVSTILYLMSLQSLAKAPFRVVDEINQGMDPNNERMVHGRMVDVACQENTAQYFLITPKLLTDLPYHRRMKISCIFSGPHVAKIAGHMLTTQKILENTKRVALED